VAYSGQCLTSEALGGRSANRGECAQACRMAYEIVCDGRKVDLGPTQYLLSPQDLAAYDLVPRLIELGVASLKIEGRLKSPEYVANMTRHYRRAIDEAMAGAPAAFSPTDVQEMELSFSRGFSHGFLDGNNHKILVRGDYAKKRGLFVGRVASISRTGALLKAEVPVKPGDGLVFDGDDEAGIPEQGGRIYEVVAPEPRASASATRSRGGPPRPGEPGRSEPDLPREPRTGMVELRFGRDAVNLARLRLGQRVWKTDDPDLSRRLRRTFEGPPSRKVPLDVEVTAATGQPLRIKATTSTGLSAVIEGADRLEPAVSQPADDSLFRNQLGRLGGTCYELRGLKATFEGAPMVPMRLLNQLRRELVDRLEAAASQPNPLAVAPEPVLPALMEPIRAERDRYRRPGEPRGDAASQGEGEAAVELSVLCRTTAQIEAAAAIGVRTIYADYQEIKQYGAAVAAARAKGSSIFLATPRIEKPAEANLFRSLSRHGADGLLVRNAGGLAYCADRGIPFVADFSLNAANPLTVDLLRARGALRVTASYDLNVGQLVDLLDEVPADWLEIVIHQQIPMFHMEHCVFCAFLSPGTDHTNCGRPCDHHDVKLRDRVGMEHPLKADVGCRNTLFNAVPQTAAESLPLLVRRGARHLRIEFLDDRPDQVEQTVSLYRDALAGQRDARTLWKALKASNQYGVTRGPLAVL
jgi:putative protease